MSNWSISIVDSIDDVQIHLQWQLHLWLIKNFLIYCRILIPNTAVTAVRAIAVVAASRCRQPKFFPFKNDTVGLTNMFHQ